MGRKPSKNKNLPPRMRRRTQRSGKIYYYYDMGGKPRREIPLGDDYLKAVQKWAELEQGAEAMQSSTFRDAALQYIRDILPTKATRTRSDNLKELEVLYEFFDCPPALLDEIEPQHIRQYRIWRMEKAKRWYIEAGRTPPINAGGIRANRELALFSHIFNFAREIGMTAAPNPSAGVRKTKEKGRDVYIEDDIYKKAYAAACQPLRDAMDLAYLTGQRPSDTLALDEADIKDGQLEIKQGKTGQRLRILLVGELYSVIERIRARKSQYTASSTRLIVNEKGQQLTSGALRSRFDKARDDAGIEKFKFQFRDLRAKAGTDKTDTAGDIRQAQKQLGHKSVTTTEHYVRNRRGDKVGPTR